MFCSLQQKCKKSWWRSHDSLNKLFLFSNLQQYEGFFFTPFYVLCSVHLSVTIQVWEEGLFIVQENNKDLFRLKVILLIISSSLPVQPGRTFKSLCKLSGYNQYMLYIPHMSLKSWRWCEEGLKVQAKCLWKLKQGTLMSWCSQNHLDCLLCSEPQFSYEVFTEEHTFPCCCIFYVFPPDLSAVFPPLPKLYTYKIHTVHVYLKNHITHL